MRIAVITMHAVKNYGSVLQTFATQKILEDFGDQVEIINYIRRKNLDSNLLKTWTKDDKSIKKIIKIIILLPTVERWKKVFGSYINDWINISKYTYLDEKDFDEHPIEADVFCTGSDQVWNSGWNNGIEKPFYLSFVKEDYIPRVSIAASIGRSHLDEDEQRVILPFLQKYKYITVREKSALKIVQAMGLSNSALCLDPTLLVSKEEWLRHSIPDKKRKRYVLLYQLNHDKEFDTYSQKFADYHNLQLIRVCTRYDQIRLSGKPIVLPNVRKLISLINNAEFVLTNSFHATAFCINLNKQFVSVYPDEYSSRIADLLSLFGLEERKLSSYDNIKAADKLIAFDDINQRLFELREQSLSLLRDIIHS